MATQNEKAAAYLVSANGGVAVKLCEGCGPPTHLSSSGQKILFETVRPPKVVVLLDAASGKQVNLIQSKEHREHILYAARFPPDGRWIAFHARMGSTVTRQIFAVSYREGTAPSERDWIPVTDGSAMDRQVDWSPDGNVLYFLSDRDGFRRIWAQRLNRASKRPMGPALEVHHFHHARRASGPRWPATRSCLRWGS